ncbi:MAG: DUF1841 domain-containing protein [Anaeromyxobacteraceae bacterium]
MSVAYDAERAPDAAPWSAASREDRVRAVEAFHAASQAPHPPIERARIHAALHVVVEDQLAKGEPPEAARAVARLVAGGATRHAALHEVGRVASAALQAALTTGRFDAEAYARALDALGVPPPP